MRKAEHAACTGNREYPCKIEVGKPESKTPLGRL
jgi:hypothetical protein